MRRLATVAATAVAITLAAIAPPVLLSASAVVTVPGKPASCLAEVVSPGVVDVSWTAPANDGGAPVTRYVVKIKGQAAPVYQTDNDPNFYDYADFAWRWTDPYTASSVWQVRAVNSKGFGAWCETGLSSGPTPTPTPTVSATPTPTVSATPSPTATATPPLASGLPCSPGSFYKDDVRDNTVDAGLTASFRSFMATHIDQKAITWPKVNLNDSWSGLNAISSASDPIWKITGGQSDPALNILRTQGFHMADEVLNENPTGSEDRLLVVFDSASGFVAQMADTTPNFANHTIAVSSAGIMWYSSNCLDKRNPLSDDQRNFVSRGRIAPAMQVPPEFLQAAIDRGTGIGYTMHLFFVENDSTKGFVHPMVGTEGGNSGFGAEGLRVRIAPSIDLVARGLTLGCLALARTLQENGGYIGDNSGASTQLKVGHPSQYPGMGLSTDCMKGKVSWNDFEVVTPGQQ